MESPTTATVCPRALPPLTESVQWAVVAGHEIWRAAAGATAKPTSNEPARPRPTRAFLHAFGAVITKIEPFRGDVRITNSGDRDGSPIVPEAVPEFSRSRT